MGNNLSFERPRRADITDLARNLRRQDRDEICASHGGVCRGVKQSIKQSDVAYAVRLDGKLLGICGVVSVSLVGSIGMPWWVSTRHVERHPVTFVRASREFVQLLHVQYETLQNYVDTRYGSALAWLRRIGFEVDHNATEEIGGVTFVMVRSTRGMTDSGIASVIRCRGRDERRRDICQ